MDPVNTALGKGLLAVSKNFYMLGVVIAYICLELDALMNSIALELGTPRTRKCLKPPP